MQIKKYIGGFGVFGLLGFIGRTSDTLHGAQMLLSVGDYINITYDVFYNICISVGIVTLLYILSEIIPFFWKNRNYFKIEPDTSMRDAIEYIITGSNFGNTLSGGSLNYVQGWESLKQAMQNNKIIIWGVSDKNKIPKKIKKSEFVALKFEPDFNFQRHNPREITYLNDVKIKKDTDTIFSNLLVSKKQLKKVWPPHGNMYSRHG